MRASQHHLPLRPLLHTFVAAGLSSPADLVRLPGPGSRFAAILSATARFLYPDFLERAAPAEFAEALVRFYEAVVDPPLHVETLRRRAGLVRHAIAAFLHCRDSLPRRLAACLDADGPYRVVGLGPAFWSALLQGLAPTIHPGWTPATVAGLRRLRLVRLPQGASPADVYAALIETHARVRSVEPKLTALQIDHFLILVASLEGRHLERTAAAATCPVAQAVRRLRARLLLRELLRERGQTLADAQTRLESGLAKQDGKLIGAALAAADPQGWARAPLDWARHGDDLTLWCGRFWESDDPYTHLTAFWQADPLPGAGLWLPAAVLHLRDAQRFGPWNDTLRQGYAALDDDTGGPPAERYRAFNEGIAWLRQRHGLHPLEVPGVLAALATGCAPDDTGPRPLLDRFGGFCADTFAFLRDLAVDNRREWLESARDRYRFAVRRPLVELCQALAVRYVEPVLRGTHGWDCDTAARNGRALTSICRNAFGRGQIYQTTLWIVFGTRSPEGRRAGAQFFVRLDAAGVRFGLRVGRRARATLQQLRSNVDRHGDLLFRALTRSGALTACRFGDAESGPPVRTLLTDKDVRVWAAGRSLEASCAVAAGEPLLHGDELVGAVLLTFDRLTPLFVCAALEDAGPFLTDRIGHTSDGSTAPFGEADFRRATSLGPDWLRRARGLLELKRQLILQGVPGTGKTHVARCLARLLTGGDDRRVRLVQFHPAYSYEEFVEGIKVRSVESDGRHDVTYPVEDGLLCAFAAEAARRPAETHVLIIDEINRGNLPRIFGELLYLLEYRDQEVGLPYSRRGFRLPVNLYLLGTMNVADRSVALVDQALRRRFSFLEMPPDANVLAGYLGTRVPAGGAAFAGQVLDLFARLNDRLVADLGPQGRIGHSFFMVPDLDEDRLRLVWDHHIRPLLEEHFAGQPTRLSEYDLDALRTGRRGRRAPAGSR